MKILRSLRWFSIFVLVIAFCGRIEATICSALGSPKRMAHEVNSELVHQVAIVGNSVSDDDRVKLDKSEIEGEQSPFNGIGSVTGGFMDCCGVLAGDLGFEDVDPDIIVFNAHCVAQNGREIKKVEFGWQYHEGSPRQKFEAEVIKIGAPDFPRPTTQPNEDHLRRDYAFARIRPAISRKLAQPLKLRSLTEEQLKNAIQNPRNGYALPQYDFEKDGMSNIWVDKECRVTGSTKGLITHSCHNRPGSSGCPLIDKANRSVVALNRGSFTSAKVSSSTQVNHAVPVKNFAWDLNQELCRSMLMQKRSVDPKCAAAFPDLQLAEGR